MNLTTIARMPAEAFAPLGKSRRQQDEEAAASQPKPEHQPMPITAPPGYRVTPQGGLQRNDQPWILPEVKGRLLKAEPGVCLESGEFIPASNLADDTATCGVVPSVYSFERLYLSMPPHLHKASDEAIEDVIGAPWSGRTGDIPADRRADVIRALNALGV